MSNSQAADSYTQLPVKAHLLAGWPLLLVLFGGAIGVVYAVLAYMLNIKIYQSTLSKLNKVLANLLCSMSALSGWWFSAQLIQGQLF
ncbi:hypothetical protein MUB05_11005 [Acinetobacter indicus]|uniref:hypothetical protein n=1 Tax=Acinetobacter TaxID=469 RepID=UPI001362D1AF|nr:MULTISPECIES: hypothetical protein [Acinetobacter]MCO8102977.1 hypothetical protein [Acinetobacter indicus]MCP0917110.1 hypothetical protein [Acinetobacter indicus]MCP0920223.1 hypothetical protein [Acinetobacter indicus]MCP0922890.1 hypothetical protein [Acinetobacter indicus]UNW10214.1 hypothetical protein MOW14_03305 [Acinetobacter indicus]